MQTGDAQRAMRAVAETGKGLGGAYKGATNPGFEWSSVYPPAEPPDSKL